MKVLNRHTLELSVKFGMPVTVYGMMNGGKFEWTGVIDAYCIDKNKGFVKLWIGDMPPLHLEEAFFYKPGIVFYGPEEQPAVTFSDPADTEAPGKINPERVALMKSWGMEVK